MQQLLRIEAVGVDDGFSHLVKQGLHDFVTAQLYVKHGFGMVDAAEGNVSATLVCLALLRIDLFDEAALEGAIQYLFFISQESIYTFILKLADDTGTHIHHLLVAVSDFFSFYAIEYALLSL